MRGGTPPPCGATLLRVERGAPDEAELAALTAVIAALMAGAAAVRPVPAARLWGAPHLGGPSRSGTAAWRSSGLPR